MKALRKIKKLSDPPPLSDIRTYETYWLRRGESRERARIEDISQNHRKKILARLLDDHCSLLDIGCGNCSFFDVLSQTKPTIDATGTEISDDICEIGRSKGYRVIKKDYSREQVAEEYDYITVLNVLEHMYHAEELMMNLKNAFRKSLFVSVPNLGYIKYRIQLGLFGRMPNTGCFYHIREHIRFWTYADFHAWADYYGFRVNKVWGNSWSDYLNKFPGLFASNILYELKRKNHLS